MPFCPSCHAEYRAETTNCADCGLELVDRLEDLSSQEDMTDVYVCYDGGQAERLANVLRNRGIHVLLRDRSSSAFPTTVGKTAQCIIAVAGDQVELARSVIEAAVHDGVVERGEPAPSKLP